MTIRSRLAVDLFILLIITLAMWLASSAGCTIPKVSPPRADPRSTVTAAASEIGSEVAAVRMQTTAQRAAVSELRAAQAPEPPVSRIEAAADAIDASAGRVDDNAAKLRAAAADIKAMQETHAAALRAADAKAVELQKRVEALQSELQREKDAAGRKIKSMLAWIAVGCFVLAIGSVALIFFGGGLRMVPIALALLVGGAFAAAIVAFYSAILWIGAIGLGVGVLAAGGYGVYVIVTRKRAVAEVVSLVEAAKPLLPDRARETLFGGPENGDTGTARSLLSEATQRIVAEIRNLPGFTRA